MDYLFILFLAWIDFLIIFLFNSIDFLSSTLSESTLFMIIGLLNGIIGDFAKEGNLPAAGALRTISLERVGWGNNGVRSFWCSIGYKIVALIGHISLAVNIQVSLRLNVYHCWDSFAIPIWISLIPIHSIFILFIST